MKKLLFIGIVALMVQSLGAVTLPSSSYSPYSGGGSGSSEVVFSSGSVVTGKFVELKSGEDGDFDECISSTQPGQPERMSCCTEAFNSCISACGSDYDCMDNCESRMRSCPEAPSLPLDGGLSILLLLSVAGGAAKVLRNRRVNS